MLDANKDIYIYINKYKSVAKNNLQTFKIYYITPIVSGWFLSLSMKFNSISKKKQKVVCVFNELI